MTDYYTSQKVKLLKSFDKLMNKHGKAVLIKQFDDNFAELMIPEIRLQFEKILPELPYVGGRKNAYTRIIIVNGGIIAVYKVMKEKGKTIEETLAVACGISEKLFESFPKWILKLGGWFMLGPLSRQYLKKQAAQSQKLQYSEDWVYTFVDSKGKDFDSGLDFSECAVIKLYDKMGLQDLKPYCNFFDVIMGKHMNMGCIIGPHLGSGGEICSFRYQRGRPTPIPEKLKPFIKAD
ncbi:MAG: L-2-amino-thiazoline-4-carboxylic acid hydrolase [Deltaproteobacteria bacterium]|nr:L-2-amino-thiazoline-4-carboxylic acid hydrolase [Deltaproteobacteria bacterium]